MSGTVGAKSIGVTGVGEGIGVAAAHVRARNGAKNSLVEQRMGLVRKVAPRDLLVKLLHADICSIDASPNAVWAAKVLPNFSTKGEPR